MDFILHLLNFLDGLHFLFVYTPDCYLPYRSHSHQSCTKVDESEIVESSILYQGGVIVE